MISLHPERRHQVCVRWITRMREQSIIDLTDIASVRPRHPKCPRVSANTTGAGSTAHHRINLTTDNRSASTATSHADLAAGAQTNSTTGGSAASAADGHTDPTAQGHHDPTTDGHAAPTVEDRAGPNTGLCTNPDATADARTLPPTDAPHACTVNAPSGPDGPHRAPRVRWPVCPRPRQSWRLRHGTREQHLLQRAAAPLASAQRRTRAA